MIVAPRKASLIRYGLIMTDYSDELKNSLIARMLPPNNISVSDIAKETNISKSTLYTWRTKARKQNIKTAPAVIGELSDDAKFNIVLETATLNELETGEYCRKKGIFPLQIQAWKEACIHANSMSPSKAEKQTIRSQKKEIKSLEKELRRKEKALAETAALLVLQKKVQFLWEDQEEEKFPLKSV